jgi:hypothetical protein
MSTIFADKFKNASGGNNVKVNQLSGIDTAGSITVQGEGTATTNLQQGLAKAWLRMDGGDGSSPSIGDSFNITSIADQAVGNYRVTITNDMGSAQYSATTAGGGSADNNTLTAVSTQNPNFTAGTLDLDCVYVHTTAFDPKIVSLALHGDLA